MLVLSQTTRVTWTRLSRTNAGTAYRPYSSNKKWQNVLILVEMFLMADVGYCASVSNQSVN